MANDSSKKIKILVGSPIHQKPEILSEFLISLKELRKEHFDITYLFIDDNENPESSKLLLNFSNEEPKVVISESEDRGDYICDEITHRWDEGLIWKVAKFKNMIIQIALEYNFDYLFLIDSDIVLHPNTLEHLASSNKDIISEIFWTKWNPDTQELPQVWLGDHYNQFSKKRNEVLTKNEILIRQQHFVSQLRQPGVYEVGGLGACTLISRNALEKGVNFEEIKNLSFWGEDRHFCIRAAALGIPLHVDTYFPAYHLYRESDLTGVKSYKENFTDYLAAVNNSIIDKGSVLTSRFFKATDPKVEKFVFDLPNDWWSRFYEYAWASEFIDKDDVSLDAASGICHPFKFYLNQHSKEVYACDIDDRINDEAKILQDIKEIFDSEAAMNFGSEDLKGIIFSRANLNRLPYDDAKFNKVYCLSVLEHLPKEDIKKSLREFKRVLKNDGKIILTFDFPAINLEFLFNTVKEVGLKFAGEIDTKLLEDGLYTTLWGGLCCFRAVLIKDDFSNEIEQDKVQFNYKKWWEHNYALGGTSGSGSYGVLAEFKAEIINQFIEEKDIQTVMEFGCGDGNNLSYMNYKNYLGLDIANSALNICREKYRNDSSKDFKLYEPHNFISNSESAELVVCLDVLYHIIDDYEFEKTLNDIFTCASKFVVLYTRITSDNELEIAPTIKDRDIMKHISKYPDIKISSIIKQRYPNLSTADFIILEKVNE